MIIDGNEYGCWDGIVKIVYEDKCRTIHIFASGDEDDKFFTLNDCLQAINYKDKMGRVLVIIEDYLSGGIYQYGNHRDENGNNLWEIHGNTRGFA